MFCPNCGNEVAEGIKFCSKCGHNLQTAKKQQPAKTVAPSSFRLESVVSGDPIKFYNVPLGQLVFLSFITVGLYQIYWHIRNWDEIKKARNLKIQPFWRGIFAPFFAYELFKYILSNAKELGYPKNVNPTAGVAAVSYFILNIATAGAGRYTPMPEEAYFYLFFWLFLLLLSILPLILFQKAIKFSAEKLGDDTVHKFAGKEIALIVIGIVLFAFSIWGSLPVYSEQESNVYSSGDQQITPNNEVNPNWSKFVSDTGDFEVLLPVRPTKETESYPLENGITAYSDLYTSELSDNEGFIMATYTYSTVIDDSDIDTNLQNIAEGIVSATPSATMTNSQFTYHGNSRAIGLAYSTPDGLVRSRLMYVDQKYHYIAYFYTLPSYKADNYNKFINSFKTY